MHKAEQPGRAPDATDLPAGEVAPDARKPWLTPRLDGGKIGDRTEGSLGHGADARSCLS
jgi:hypothetical protein